MNKLILAILLFFTTISSYSAEANLQDRNMLETLGNSFIESGTKEIKWWIDGRPFPMPRLYENTNHMVDTWTFTATTKREKQLREALFSNNETTRQSANRLYQQETNALRLAASAAVESGEMQSLIDNLQNELFYNSCDSKYSNICMRNTAALFGLFVAFKRLTWIGLYTKSNFFDTQMERLLTLLRARTLSTDSKILVRVIGYAYSGNINLLDHIQAFLNESSPVHKKNANNNIEYISNSSIPPFRISNHWRINSVMLNMILKANSEMNSGLASQVVERLEVLLSPAINEINSWTIDQRNVMGTTIQELYVNLDSLASYYKSRGEISKFEKVRQLQGNLRATQPELLKNSFERFIYKWIWGGLTDYGTSIIKVLIALLLYFVSIWALICCYWKKATTFLPMKYIDRNRIREIQKRGPRKNFGESLFKSFESAVLFVSLRDDDEIRAKGLLATLKLSSTLLISTALGYFIFYFSRTF